MNFEFQISNFRSRALRLWASCLGLSFLLPPKAAEACSVCYGNSDSDMAKGFGWGVLSLLAVVVFVLSGFVAFFIYIAKRSAAMSQAQAPAALADTTQNA